MRAYPDQPLSQDTASTCSRCIHLSLLQFQHTGTGQWKVQWLGGHGPLGPTANAGVYAGCHGIYIPYLPQAMGNFTALVSHKVHHSDLN